MYYAFRGIQLQDLWDGVKSASPFWVSMSILLGILSYVIRAARWQILLEPLGHKPKLSDTYNATMTGYLANLALPRIGEITRCGVLSNLTKLPFEKIVGTVVVERIFDLLFLLLSVFVAVLISIEVFGGFLLQNIWQPVSSAFVGMFSQKITLFVIVLLSVIAVIVLCYIFRDSLKNMGAVKKVKSLGKGFAEGIKSGLKMKQRWLFLFYSLLISICYWMMSYTVVLAIPAAAGKLTVIDALFLYILGGLGWVVPTIAGMGSFHYLVALGLGIYGIGRDQGTIFAIISHESQVLFMLILGFVALAVVSNKIRKKKPLVNT